MKKKFKDTKVGGIALKILGGALDVIPGSKTVSGIAKALANKNLDRNGDGKVSLDDFKPLELVGLFGGLAILSILASKGIIEIQILKDIAGIFGL